MKQQNRVSIDISICKMKELFVPFSFTFCALFLLLIWIIAIRNGKIVWKHGPYCWYFPLNLKYLWWSHRAYIKTAKNDDFWEELVSENDFEAVLATSYCYDHCAKASEAVQKIATDKKSIANAPHVL